MMNSEIGFGRKVLQVFEDNGLSFEHMPSGIDTLTVYVHQSEFEEKEQNIISGLHRAVAPVSYTHLDVYKRQGIYGADQFAYSV